ncbi:hypothetical protein BDV37DRAFT_264876 [Aspergillus pseudonomiae]|uniref:Zn(2)-C6 fungal-type domain-containing protein n=1 Tax=Aspergillus pseudonomiae TaxID=1506151 RepID=A0A5N7CUA8_9EURO|nr:uncharacterized protein BDV37DRAFT_264876 [Aspergillus pseudonomiae]KAE8397786.1 hypothetical protein BDV37DRAFT_264876 [Aspergillus pseudonomiae]
MMKPARARNACMRCRRQKLKVCYPPGHSRGLILTACECDNIRPCQLCSRAGVDCQSVVSKR